MCSHLDPHSTIQEIVYGICYDPLTGMEKGLVWKIQWIFKKKTFHIATPTALQGGNTSDGTSQQISRLTCPHSDTDLIFPLHM